MAARFQTGATVFLDLSRSCFNEHATMKQKRRMHPQLGFIWKKQMLLTTKYGLQYLLFDTDFD